MPRSPPAPATLAPDEIKRYLNRATEIAHGDHPPEAVKRLVKDIRFAKGELPMPEDPEHALWKFINPDRFDSVMAECLHFPRVLDAVSSTILLISLFSVSRLPSISS